MIRIPSPLASIDFEVYSEAGFSLSPEGKWKSAVKGKPGIKLTGTYNYAVHPSTYVRSLRYDLHDGLGIRLWFLGLEPPQELFDHIARGGLIEAHNSIFEYWIWNLVMTDWPPLPLEQMTCTMSRCAAFGLPKKLGKVHLAIDMPVQKMDIGDELIKEFCVPHNRKRKKFTIGQLHEYCGYDVATETALSHRMPDLSEEEHAIWLMDQRINTRGVQIDVDAARALADKVEEYVSQAGADLSRLTKGAADSPRQVARIGKWLEENGLELKRTKKGNYKLDRDSVEELYLQCEDGSPQKQVLTIRQHFALASVDKIKTMCHMVDDTGRLRNLFSYYGAHTGRWTSHGVQLQNLARGNLERWQVEQIFDEIKNGNWSSVENESPLATISSLVRGLFVAAPGNELICSDFSAIEGRGQAMLSGEQWRIDVFNGDGLIYERTAADITGIPYEEIIRNAPHPARKIGKVGELSGGFGAWINGWLRFGAGKYLKTYEEQKNAILTWRGKSPMIPEMWGGQVRKHPKVWSWKPEIFGLEGAALNAIMCPDKWYSYRDISFMHDTRHDTLLCRLPSGRCLWYRQPRLEEAWDRRAEMKVWAITYRSWSQQDGWGKKYTHGPKLFENIVQAACRDIMAQAMLRMERNGYPVVIHVHDEPVAEVPMGFGSVEEVESLMEYTEGWYSDWPIRAGGGWRGHRFKK